MKKLLCGCLLILGICTSAQAGQVSDIKAALVATRAHTMAMLSENDVAVLEMRYEEALQSSKQVDLLLSLATDDKTLSSVQARLAEIKAVWDQFKITRDKEIIPALFAGERDKARALAQKVQAGRFKMMNDLLDTLSR